MKVHSCPHTLEPPITVHHLNNSRSQRTLWLREQIGLPYEIKRYQRDPKTNLAPPELKAINARGKLPIIEDSGNVLIESGAAVDYPMDRSYVGRIEQGEVNLAIEKLTSI